MPPVEARWAALACLAESGGAAFFVAADGESMRRMASVLRFFAPGVETRECPAWDTLPYDRASPSAAITGQRLATLARLAAPGGPLVVVTTARAALQILPGPDEIAAATLRLAIGESLALEDLVARLTETGYLAAEPANDPGEMAARENRLDVFPPGSRHALRLDFAAGRLAAIASYDPLSQRATGEALEHAVLPPGAELPWGRQAIGRFIARLGVPESDPLVARVAAGRRVRGLEHFLPLFAETPTPLLDFRPQAPIVVQDGAEAAAQLWLDQMRDAFATRERLNLPALRGLPPEDTHLTWERWQEVLAARRADLAEPAPWPEPRRVVAAGAKVRAVARALAEFGETARAATRFADVAPDVLAVVPMEVSEGWRAGGLEVLPPPDEVAADEVAPSVALDVAGLMPGDLVVHPEHGVALLDGVEIVESEGIAAECLRLVFADEAALLVPAERADLVTRHGAASGAVALDRLGGTAWARKRAAVEAELADVAAELVATARSRASITCPPLVAALGPFAARFPHVETRDQRRAIRDALADLAAGRPMDRLVVGDVGFGKTEIALRAAFVVAESGRQVAVVTPTTPLARQHADDFRDRFAGTGLRVELLSRALPPAAQRRLRQEIADGAVAVVVGTHTLLNTGFARLGLVVIDEEHRLGVRQKEALKRLDPCVHVLTLTATPIPRTLQMAEGGLRAVSVIATPPVARRPVATFVAPWDPLTLRQALLRERARGGQSFVISPRIEDLDDLRARLAAMAPELDVALAHGKLPPARLDAAMIGFARGENDVLLATNIIESGLNIPAANTLVVHRADLFGLAALHQLRGRVGRGGTRAFAYFTTEPGQDVAEPARRRLDTIATYTDPGAGFRLAARDRDLRGAGTLAGEKQSGHGATLGAEMMEQMLRDAILGARGQPPNPVPVVRLGASALLPETYVPDAATRIDFYRRLAADRIRPGDLADELEDRFGPLPPEAELLLLTAQIRRLARTLGIRSVEAGPKGAVLGLGPPLAIPGGRERAPGEVVVAGDWADAKARAVGVARVLKKSCPSS